MAKSKWKSKKQQSTDWRLTFFRYGLAFFGVLIILRLFTLQVLNHDFYQALASGQHEIFKELFPSRGTVFIQDLKDGIEVPLATNQQLAFLYADPRHIEEPVETAEKLAQIFGYDEEKILALAKRLDQPDDPYEPLEKRVDDETLDRVLDLDLKGIHFIREESRYYPEPHLGGHIIGFIGQNEDGTHSGKYGIEGYFDKELSGTPGFLRSERDITGRFISVGDHSIERAIDGADISLTIDRTIQFQACDALKRAVDRHQADGGSVIVLEPNTGQILAMCGAPDFDPNIYNKVEDISVYNNPTTFGAYESGSVFKAFTLAAGLDTESITPSSTYEDTGEVEIDVFTIKNSDEEAHGIQTMTQVLEKSLNTGTIHVMRETGIEKFTEYVKAFGFGSLYDIELDTESPGDIRPLNTGEEIYAATSSYGQGMTVTPLQLAAGYGAIANGGILRKPYIVKEVRYPDGVIEHRSPQDIRRVIEERTSRLLGAMLISVVEHGHAGKAGVDGYYLAGKTGTAQVARTDGAGYKENETIASFVGFGPIEDPKFVIVTRIDHPKDVPWASQTAAPLFSEIAEFLLKYYEVRPTR